MSQVAELIKEASKLDLQNRTELITALLDDLDASPRCVRDEKAVQRLHKAAKSFYQRSTVMKWTAFRVISLCFLISLAIFSIAEKSYEILGWVAFMMLCDVQLLILNRETKSVSDS